MKNLYMSEFDTTTQVMDTNGLSIVIDIITDGQHHLHTKMSIN